jgi:hypothetical protein
VQVADKDIVAANKIAEDERKKGNADPFSARIVAEQYEKDLALKKQSAATAKRNDEIESSTHQTVANTATEIGRSVGAVLGKLPGAKNDSDTLSVKLADRASRAAQSPTAALALVGDAEIAVGGAMKDAVSGSAEALKAAGAKLAETINAIADKIGAVKITAPTTGGKRSIFDIFNQPNPGMQTP